MSRTLVRVLVLVLVLLLFRPKRPLISAGLDAVRWCKDPGLVLTGWKVKVSVLHHIRLDRETTWRHFELDGVGGRESQRRSLGGKPGSKSGGSSPGPALVLTGGKVKVSMLYRVRIMKAHGVPDCQAGVTPSKTMPNGAGLRGWEPEGTRKGQLRTAVDNKNNNQHFK